MPFRFTVPMQKRVPRRTITMLQNALHHFPELQGKTITVGYTAAHLGVAVPEDFAIRLRARKVSYNTIGHELTHLVQGMRLIPAGEKQCDIWTLSRSPLFCDEAPTYLELPPWIRARWADFALRAHRLCTRAIAIRNTHRQYIRWVERELRLLAHAAAGGQGQLFFAFDPFS
ncbi:MAG: hypothetical protein ACREOO_14505 [bacterium]